MKLKEVSTDFNVLYSRENNPWVGGVPHLTNNRVLYRRDLGQEPVLGRPRRSRAWSPRRVGLPYKAIFSGKVSWSKLSWKTGVCSISLTGVSRKFRLT